MKTKGTYILCQFIKFYHVPKWWTQRKHVKLLESKSKKHTNTWTLDEERIIFLVTAFFLFISFCFEVNFVKIWENTQQRFSLKKFSFKSISVCFHSRSDFRQWVYAEIRCEPVICQPEKCTKYFLFSNQHSQLQK